MNELQTIYYALLHRNKVLMTFNLRNGDVIYDEGNIVDYDRLPTLVKRNGLTAWLTQRSIDTHRTNSRVLARMLRIRQTDVIQNVIKAYASSLTDNYWIKPVSSSITYRELIAKRRDFLHRVSLLGEFNFDLYETNIEPNNTPELTLGGSYEKCWIYDEVKKVWFMVKKGACAETFNELLASELANVLEFEHVTYDVYDNNSHFVRCDNFIHTRNNVPIYDYEPMCYYLFNRDDDDDFDVNLQVLKSISRDNKDLTRKLVKQYVNMLIFDVLILNFDRHTENYGLIKDADTQQIKSLAPLFDHNLSLLKNSLGSMTTGNMTIKNEYIPFLKRMFTNYKFKLPLLSKKQIEYCVNKSWFRVFNHSTSRQEVPHVSKEFLIDFIYNKYSLLGSSLNCE